MSLSIRRNSLPALCFTWKSRLTGDPEWIEDFRDDFDDAVIGDDWLLDQTEEDAWVPAGTKTVTEAADLLTIAIAEGVSGWWSEASFAGSNKAPKAYIELGSSPPYRIITKIINFTFNPDGDNFGGLIVGTHPNHCFGMYGFGKTPPAGVMTYGANIVGTVAGYVEQGGAFPDEDSDGYIWWSQSQAHWPNNTWINTDEFKAEYRAGLNHRIYMFGMKDEAGPNRIRVRSNRTLYDTDGSSAIPVWLKVEIDEDWDITFWFSTDGVNYTQYEHAAAPFEVNVGDGLSVGLFASNNNSGKGATSVSFEYFLIERLVSVGEFITTQDCVSFIDARAPDVFYSGRIKSMSSLKRAIDDKTGLFKIADMNVVLINNDRKYSRLATEGILKNQEMTLSHVWTERSEASKLHVIDLVVEDQRLKGEDFHIKLKDITQKYFTKKIPGNICTEEDYPNIHPDHVGRYMPEVLGRCVVGTEYESPGAIEAVHVSTIPPYQYLLSRAPLNAVTAVYVDGVLQAPASYAFIPGSPSLLNLAGDEGDSRITFDAEGYAIAGWNSTNGYIQNLSHIIQYLLQYIMEMPAEKIDSAAFDDVATFFENKEWDEDGFLILQKKQDAMEILRQLLFTGGIKGYVALGGNFTVGVKNEFNYEIDSLDSHVFSQLELMGPPERQWNLPNAINTIKARYGYIPWQRLWLSALEEYKDNDYDGEMEGDIPIHDLPPDKYYDWP